MTSTFERLRAILVKDYPLKHEQVTQDARLDALGIDSLGLADMLFNIEDEFHINVPAEPVDLLTIGDVVGFIDGLISVQIARTALSAAVTPPTLMVP